MSKRESITRYNLIIKKLRRYKATFQEIADYLAMESELQEYDLNISKRTFQRDLEDIRSIYNIDIQYDYSKKVYFIDFDQQPQITERIVEAFETFNALNISDRLSNHIHFENRKPQGTENLYGILHAIKNRLKIRFTYRKFWEDQDTIREVEPYALKEFKNRWYILVKDKKDNEVKCFGLDRLTDLEITKKTFLIPDKFDLEYYFHNSFGIISPNADKPEEVILSFDFYQGKYIKSLPLHGSQEILKDDEEELQIRLRLFITHDFIMELLSFGMSVKVIKPDSLIQTVKESYTNALKFYE